MALLDDASDQDIKRLLELFPVSCLREAWPNLRGSKEELCYEAAKLKQPGRVVDFVDQYLSCCKQHVYVFEAGEGQQLILPAAVGAGEMVKQVAGVRALYIIRVQYRVVLRDPLEETTLDFLWPVRIDLEQQHLAQQHMVLRFVTLEKTLSTYFDRPYYVGARNVDEKDIAPVVGEGLVTTDLHKGVKKLWGDKFMDSSRTGFKKPNSRAFEAMDEDLGIRENNPDLYALLVDSPLFNTLFAVAPDKNSSVGNFSVDPGKGYIVFPRYSEVVGDTDNVIGELLKNNS